MLLQLDVRINGRKIGMIGRFEQMADQRIAATREELESLGLRPPTTDGAAAVPLDGIAGLTYTYDPAQQTIDMTVSDVLLKPHEIGPPREIAAAISDNQLRGAIINYGLTGTLFDSRGHPAAPAFWPPQLHSLSLDTRVFGPWGTLANSGYVGSALGHGDQLVRLESTWSWSDPEALRTWRLGDVLSRGPAWSRPFRLGGGQVQTNFGLRPDLVTAPLPAFRGTAVVPSVVDVFINNAKVYSQETPAAPFLISNLPTVVGAGTARVVVRDASGRETVQTSSFYTAPILLRGGLFDYSIEAGLVRTNYGLASHDYYDRPVASGSARYGWSNTVTVESHGELGPGLVNSGIGANFTLFDLSLLSLAASGSSHNGAVGAQGYVAIETGVGPAKLRVSTQRTFGPYRDLAAVIQPRPTSIPHLVPIISGTSLLPPKALDIATVSFVIPHQAGSISLGAINRELEDKVRSSRILTASYSRPLTASASLFASGFHDLTTQNIGALAGLSVTLGDWGHGQLGYSRNSERNTISADYAKAATREPGNVGWRIASREGDFSYRSAAATYQSSVARVEAGVQQSNNHIRGQGTVDGAIIATTSGVLMSNRIDDAFAVVDVGAPDVDVLLENRKIARTDMQGRALIPGLRSYQRNKISIDPTNLPPDMVAPDVTKQVVPGDRNGVETSLQASRTIDAAIVAIRGREGSFVPVGSVGRLAHSGREFVVGYDGRAFIEGLATDNTFSIAVGEQSCSGTFRFHRRPGAQVVIENVMCR